MILKSSQTRPAYTHTPTHPYTEISIKHPRKNFKMSDVNLRTNSSIELSDIRKLDILLTQCESSSCENICIDCCAKLGSVDDDDDENNDDNGSGISGMFKIIRRKKLSIFRFPNTE